MRQLNVLLLRGGGVGGRPNWHEIPTSCQCLQSWTPQPLCLHSPTDDSLPLHRTLSNQMCPVPYPNTLRVTWPMNLQLQHTRYRRHTFISSVYCLTAMICVGCRRRSLRHRSSVCRPSVVRPMIIYRKLSKRQTNRYHGSLCRSWHSWFCCRIQIIPHTTTGEMFWLPQAQR